MHTMLYKLDFWQRFSCNISEKSRLSTAQNAAAMVYSYHETDLSRKIILWQYGNFDLN